jgi:hypothetical protein
MPPHGLYGRTRGVRWSKELDGFEMRCDDCAIRGQTCYWPLTREFWDAYSLQRCRACNLAKKKRESKRRFDGDSEHREKRRASAMTYYRENKSVIRMKHTLYMRAYREKQITE